LQNASLRGAVPMSRPEHDRLDSWKEIGNYLGRDARTVRRWERERGLPVHRPPGTARATVYGFRSEIDAWLRNHDGKLDAEATVRVASQPVTEASLHLIQERSAPALVSTTVSSHWLDWLGGWSRHRVTFLVAVLVLLASVVVAVYEVRSRRDIDVGAITFSGQQVLAWSGGRVAWHYDLGQPIDAARSETHRDMTDRFRVVDLNGEGHREILAAAPLLVEEKDDSSTDALLCFTSRGKLLWRHDFRDTVSFGGENCGRRWEIRSLLVSRNGSRLSILCSISSYPMSASLVYRLDPAGRSARWFVNYGHIICLSEAHTPAGSFLLAGGINNEYNCAILAVLSPEAPSGHPPETNPSKSDCQGCPSGQPYRYFLFPRSEVNQILGPPYNQIARILRAPDGIELMTHELKGGDLSDIADWTLYRLSLDFRVLSATFSDQYWEDHRRLSAEGKINHRVEDCQERLKPITVRVWSPEEGWSDVKLPPIAPRLTEK
jgi:hypothetical protein